MFWIGLKGHTSYRKGSSNTLMKMIKINVELGASKKAPSSSSKGNMRHINLYDDLDGLLINRTSLDTDVSNDSVL